MAIPNKSRRQIEFLSPPAPVSMAEHWFEIASVDHFWVRRRFEVLQNLAGQTIRAARELAGWLWTWIIAKTDRGRFREGGIGI
jgi:hypothetical protein